MPGLGFIYACAQFFRPVYDSQLCIVLSIQGAGGKTTVIHGLQGDLGPVFLRQSSVIQ